jgi:hypothetical protein
MHYLPRLHLEIRSLLLPQDRRNLNDLRRDLSPFPRLAESFLYLGLVMAELVFLNLCLSLFPRIIHLFLLALPHSRIFKQVPFFSAIEFYQQDQR